MSKEGKMIELEEKIKKEQTVLNGMLMHPKRFKSTDNVISVNGFPLIGLPDEVIDKLKASIEGYLESRQSTIEERIAKANEIRKKNNK